jgi:hypothetical protein
MEVGAMPRKMTEGGLLIGRRKGRPSLRWTDDVDIDIFVNCNWVDTRWQYTFTHKQYIEHHN